MVKKTVKKRQRKVILFGSAKNPEKAGVGFYNMIKEMNIPIQDFLTKEFTMFQKEIKTNTAVSLLIKIDSFPHNLRAQIESTKIAKALITNPSYKETLNNFFVGLPKGWKLEIDNRKSCRYWFHLSIPQSPFTLTDKGLKVTFRNFVVGIKGRRKNANLEINLKTTGKTHEGPTCRIHPHYSGSSGSLCEGEGATAIMKAEKAWDIISLYMMYTAVLTNYRRTSAYSPLDSFTNVMGYRCGRCGRWKPKEDMEESAVTCSYCRKVYCQKCAKIAIISAKEKGCYLCIEEAELSGSKPVVNLDYCISCKPASLHKCSVCKKDICSEHRTPCGICDAVVCSSCQVKCQICGYFVHPGCLAKRKEYGKLKICSYCSKHAPISVRNLLDKTKNERETDE